MSRIEQFSIERAGASLSEWTDALSTRIGHVPPSSWDERFTTCRTVGEVAFVGRIEHGDVGEITLAKVTTRTPHHLTMAQRDTSLPPSPMVLMFQMGGRCRVEQDRRACTLYSGDWCLLDTRHPSLIDALDSQNENLSLRLACPSDPETLSVLSNAAARRWSTGAGTPRILRATVAETFDQMNSLSNLGNRGLERAITALVWQAVREQLEQAVTSLHRDLQSAGAKRFIEARLQDPELSVDTIAQGCGMSVRSLYRAFSDDSEGSLSRYVWARRLNHCAAALGDPRQRHRPMTDICFALGFNSSSHFSRLFKERFGCTPSEYRSSVQSPGSVFEIRDGRGLSQLEH